MSEIEVAVFCHFHPKKSPPTRNKRRRRRIIIITNKYVINRPSRAWMYVVRQHTYYTQDNNYSTYKLPISQC